LGRFTFFFFNEKSHFFPTKITFFFKYEEVFKK